MSSFRRREEEITKREKLLEQKEAEIMEREELLEQEVAETEKIEELLERATETGSKAREALQQVLVRQNASLLTAKRGLGPSPMENPSTKRRRIVMLGQGDDLARDLSMASDHVQDVWRQIEFPAGWTTEDSAKLLFKFNEAKARK